jgi:proton-dependent oligopeptide transporter, POT family
MMAFESWFFPALAAIASGSGLFVPSLTGQIRSLYAAGDPRLPSAYSIYYVGINFGGFVATLVCGAVGETYGWHWGFTIAGFGMLAGLCTYLLGMRHLPAGDRKPAVLADPDTADDCAELEAPRGRFAVLIGIMLVIVVFRGAYEQQGNTIALWASTGIDRSVSAHWSVPMTWFQAMNPLLIILLTSFFVRFWGWTARRGRELASLTKMVLGATLAVGSYALLALVAAHASAEHVRAGWWWLALFFFVMVSGELLILPVGLGFFGRFAPKGYESTAIATWYFAGFAGNLFAGALGTLWSQLPPAQFFALMAAVAGAAAVLLTLFIPVTTRIERNSMTAALSMRMDGNKN